MDQRSNYIRQDIEATRASLDTKLDSLEFKARQTFDLKHQVSERPWMALGAATVAGYVLGSLGGSEPEPRWQTQSAAVTYKQHANASDHTSPPAPDAGGSSVDRFLAPFDDEIAMLKTAAITTLTNFLHDIIKEYVPALGQQLKSTPQNGTSTVPRAAGSYDARPSQPHTPQADTATLNELLTSVPPDTTRSATNTNYERSIGADTTRY